MREGITGNFTRFFDVLSRSIAVLLFLALCLPLSLVVCTLSLLISKLLLSAGIVSKSKTGFNQHDQGNSFKSILILAGSKCKALHMCRLFKREGYVTIICETATFPIVAAGWSMYCDYFYKLTDPFKVPTDYVRQVINIAKKHRATYFLPIEPRHVKWDNTVISKISELCTPLTVDGQVLDELDNKFTFNQCLKRLKLRAPTCEYVTDKDQVKLLIDDSKTTCYILKPVLYDGFQRGDINVPSDRAKFEEFLSTKDISDANPFVLQNRLIPPELTSCTLVIKGEVVAHTVGNSSPVHQSFDHIDCTEVTQWVRDFIKRYAKSITGWLTFDFMKSPDDGHFYAIECNPRLHSAYILFQQSDGLVKEIERRLGSVHDNTAINQTPNDFVPIDPSLNQNYWLINELWTMLTNINNVKVLRERMHIIWTGSEAVFEFMDPLPFFVLYFGQTPGLIIKNLFHLRRFQTVDYCCSALKY